MFIRDKVINKNEENKWTLLDNVRITEWCARWYRVDCIHVQVQPRIAACYLAWQHEGCGANLSSCWDVGSGCRKYVVALCWTVWCNARRSMFGRHGLCIADSWLSVTRDETVRTACMSRKISPSSASASFIIHWSGMVIVADVKGMLVRVG